jgi:hypothetical protein
MLPLPASVLTITFTRSLLVTASVPEVVPILVDVPADPQDITTPDGFASVNDDASHFTQEETLKAEDPLGRLDKRGEETYEPLATTRAAFGKELALE